MKRVSSLASTATRSAQPFFTGVMTFQIASVIADRGSEKFELHEKYVNPKLVRLLRTIGFDRHYARACGPYLFDEAGEKYLDLLAGFGVYALGRNHPGVKNALVEVLRSDLPDLVQMDVSTLAGVLAEQLLRRAPHQERVFFCNSGTEAVEAAIKLARAATGRSKLVFCEHAFHGLKIGRAHV